MNYTALQTGASILTLPGPEKEDFVMNDWWELVIFLLFVSGGCCAWRYKSKKKNKEDHPGSEP